MNKKLLFRASLDGITQSFIFIFLGMYFVSAYSSNCSIKDAMLSGLLGAAISIFICFVLIQKRSNNKDIVCFFLISSLFFIINISIMFSSLLTFSVSFLPLREVNKADGLLILFTQGTYIAVSVLLRICVFLLLIFKNRKARKRSIKETNQTVL